MEPAWSNRSHFHLAASLYIGEIYGCIQKHIHTLILIQIRKWLPSYRKSAEYQTKQKKKREDLSIKHRINPIPIQSVIWAIQTPLCIYTHTHISFIIDSCKLEKTFKFIKSNHQSDLMCPVTKPWPSMPYPHPLSCFSIHFY